MAFWRKTGYNRKQKYTPGVYFKKRKNDKSGTAERLIKQIRKKKIQKE